MHVACLFAGLPNPWQAGGSLTSWSYINALLDAGHDVTLLTFSGEDDPLDGERAEALRGLGVEIVHLPRPHPPAPPGNRWRARTGYVRSLAWPADEALFPSVVIEGDVARAARDARPDVVLAHGNFAVSAGRAIDTAPKLALVSDPPGLSRRLRTRYEPEHPWRLGREALLYRLGATTYGLRADRRFLSILRGYNSVGMFAAHHARWAQGHGIAAWYASSPLVDQGGPDWRERRAAAPPNERPRLLMIGHLRGISSISGLHVLARYVLPGLTDALGPDGFELHIVGDYDPPESVRAALDHPAVRLRGRIAPPDDEFLRADVLLVPTPAPTGPRVRILTGFQFGCCVVAHEANRLGIPALEDGVNCLLAPAEGITDAVVRALGDPALRTRLGEAGRRLYEERFTPAIAGTAIVRELERLAGAQPAVSASLAADAGLSSDQSDATRT